MMDPLKEALSVWFATGFAGGFIILFLLGSYSARRGYHRSVAALGVNVAISTAGPLVFLVLMWVAFRHFIRKI